VAVVYTSATLSLAALEYFVHLDPADAPADVVAIPADVPDTVSRREIGVDALPATWRDYPAPEQVADVGTAWVRDSTTAVLIVPSVIVPQERNFLLNPRHRDFRRIRVGAPEPFSFDPRMWKR
jgi:RES domain-containing protein